MMEAAPRLLRNATRNMALEITRGNRHAVVTGFMGASPDGTIGLQQIELAAFDREYKEEPPPDRHGALTPRRMARCLMRSKYKLTVDCITALIDVMCLRDDEPRSDLTAIVIAQDGSFAGAYESMDDAMIVRKYLPGALIAASSVPLGTLTEDVLRVLKNEVAPDLKGRGKKLIEGVFEMAKAKAKPKKKAVAKIEKTRKERVKKADGPVAIVLAYVVANEAKLKNGSITLAQARAALETKGVVKGTISVQLPRRLKEFKINAEKGTTIAKKADTSKPAKPAAKKAAKAPAKPAKKAAKAKPAAKKAAKASVAKKKSAEVEVADAVAAPKKKRAAPKPKVAVEVPADVSVVVAADPPPVAIEQADASVH